MNMDGINDIISNLSANDIEMLKGVASSILGGSSASQPAQSSQQGNTTKPPENPKRNKPIKYEFEYGEKNNNFDVEENEKNFEE